MKPHGAVNACSLKPSAQNRGKVTAALGLEGSPLQRENLAAIGPPHEKNPPEPLLLQQRGREEVALGCWNRMMQWGSFNAQQKLHVKAVLHTVHWAF